jgi:hypothetical protein
MYSHFQRIWPVLLVSLLAPLSLRAEAEPARALCVGRLHVSPATVRIGGAFTVRGTGFTCRTPNRLLFHAAVILYQPGLGFAIFTAAVDPSGRYAIAAHMPRMVTAEDVLQGRPYRHVPTRPGTYYLTVRLSDVYLPPPADALAQIRVVR